MTVIQRIAVLMTCHNRRDTTLRCLRALYDQALPEGVRFEVYLVDDGCTDGTGDAVREQFSAVRVLQGDGNLYWCGGMRFAWAEAMKEDYDAYLWLNDDTTLLPGAIQTLLSTAREVREKEGQEGIVVGAIRDPVTGTVTYGGDANGEKVVPNGHPQKCDLINGNAVLVPACIVATVGNFDPVFTHSFGDSDYAVRARQAGHDSWLTTDYVGTGESNPKGSDWANPDLAFLRRFRILNGPKGLPFKEWRVYARRRYGCKWPLTVIKLYIRLFFPRLWTTLKRYA